MAFPDGENWKIDPTTQDFILSLLKAERSERLGSHSGAAEVREHAFFDNFDWTVLADRSARGPDFDQSLCLRCSEAEERGDGNDQAAEEEEDPFADF